MANVPDLDDEVLGPILTFSTPDNKTSATSATTTHPGPLEAYSYQPEVHVNPTNNTTDTDDDETEEMFKIRLTHWLQQMMFVSGETAEPTAETTSLVEEIVRQQVIEMVSLL